jgi:hypothetical protein
MSEEDKPKIIVDEDWKSQVEQEKEALQQEQSQQASDAAAETQDVEIPPATLPVLITTLATQAMICLGQIPHPSTGQAMTDIPQATHFVDLLQMLEEKTEGNRTAEEIAMLSNILHQLRLAVVAAEGAEKSE